MKIEQVIALADWLECSVAELCREQDSIKSIRINAAPLLAKQCLVAMFDQLNAHGKLRVLGLANDIYINPKYANRSSTVLRESLEQYSADRRTHG
jgi:hypothetical protein